MTSHRAFLSKEWQDLSNNLASNKGWIRPLVVRLSPKRGMEGEKKTALMIEVKVKMYRTSWLNIGN